MGSNIIFSNGEYELRAHYIRSDNPQDIQNLYDKQAEDVARMETQNAQNFKFCCRYFGIGFLIIAIWASLIKASQ